MRKYKVLKSVAHNLGHSFLSDMNAVSPGWTIVPEILYQVAKAQGEQHIAVDFLSGEIDPPSLRTPEVAESIANYQRQLPSLVESQGAAMEMVHGVTLNIEFRFDEPRHSRYDPEVELPSFECEVVIVDDRGSRHIGRPKKWWRE